MAIGSSAEGVLDVVEDERESGRRNPIDIEYLLTNVVPAVLTLPGLSSVSQVFHNE